MIPAMMSIAISYTIPAKGKFQNLLGFIIIKLIGTCEQQQEEKIKIKQTFKVENRTA